MPCVTILLVRNFRKVLSFLIHLDFQTLFSATTGLISSIRAGNQINTVVEEDLDEKSFVLSMCKVTDRPDFRANCLFRVNSILKLKFLTNCGFDFFHLGLNRKPYSCFRLISKIEFMFLHHYRFDFCHRGLN